MSPEQFLETANLLPEAMLLVARDGTVVAANAAAASRLGLGASELRGRSLVGLVADPAETLARYLRACARSRALVLGSLTLVACGDTKLVCRSEGGVFRPRSDQSGALILLRLIPKESAGRRFVALSQRIDQLSREILKRKQTEETLRASEERTRLIVDTALDAVVTMDAGGLITGWNPQAESSFGWTRAEAIGRRMSETIIPEKHRAAHHQGLRRFLETGQGPVLNKRVEMTALHRSGREFPMELTIAPMRRGPSCLFSAFVRDITERKQAEDEVARLRQQLELDRDYLQEEVKEARAFGAIIAQSEIMKKVLAQAEQVAGTASTVLISGETGTGKELLARAIHSLSPRRARPMVMLSCATLPATLVESELFGREKGAYTGALTRQIGRFELADGSSLFLDEVGELPQELQAKLLRVLQEGQFERLGSTKTLKVDVRVIAATNRDLEKEVKQGRFREDLYYRLNVFPIRLPPLRERREDIPLLVWAFAREIGRTMGKTIESIQRATLTALQQHTWPGNIRELRNVIERALILCQGSTLRIELPQPKAPPSEESAQNQTLAEVERRHILSVLEQAGWRVSGKQGAAMILGLNRSTLESRMAKLGIRRKR
jgi:formate hydrogenlyase transcriptional activator